MCNSSHNFAAPLRDVTGEVPSVRPPVMFLATCQENATRRGMARLRLSRGNWKSIFVFLLAKHTNRCETGCNVVLNLITKIAAALPKKVRNVELDSTSFNANVATVISGCVTLGIILCHLCRLKIARQVMASILDSLQNHKDFTLFLLGPRHCVFCFFLQVIIRGSHIIVSRLSIDVDVQILTNPSLSSGQSPKARYQVL